MLIFIQKSKMRLKAQRLTEMGVLGSKETFEVVFSHRTQFIT
jgi:hypothetical protein